MEKLNQFKENPIILEFKKTNHQKIITFDSVIEFFSKNIKQALNERLILSILFGSRARGDAKEYSDYDFLLIVDKKEKELKEKILDVEVETLNQFDKLTSCLVWEESEWNFKKRFPIGMNILREGILL